MQTTIYDLQIELYELIFINLPTPSILNCNLACKLFNDVINCNLFWKNICIRDLTKYEIDNMIHNNNYFDLYTKWFNIRKFINDTSYLDTDNNESAIVQLYNEKYLNTYYSEFTRTYFLIKPCNKFRNNGLTLPKSIKYLTNLVKLEINNYDLQTIPIELSLLNNLVSIDLSDNKITFIPNEICHMQHLVTLNLHRNKIKSIPHDINHLTSLTDLDLSRNFIDHIPPSLYKLEKVTQINLSENFITEISNDFILMKQQPKLLLHDNKIDTLSTEIINSAVASNIELLRPIVFSFNPSNYYVTTSSLFPIYSN